MPVDPASTTIFGRILNAAGHLMLVVLIVNAAGVGTARAQAWKPDKPVEIIATNWRVIVGPKGMTQAQIAFWEEALKRFTESAEWKKELEVNVWTSEYMNRAETMRFIERDHAAVKVFLTDLGLAK